MLETFEAGKIHLPSGKLVACDPLITHDMKEFVIHFPVGDFPVFVHKERDSNCIAYVEIVFQNEEATTFKMATTEIINKIIPFSWYAYFCKISFLM